MKQSDQHKHIKARSVNYTFQVLIQMQKDEVLSSKCHHQRVVKRALFKWSDFEIIVKEVECNKR